MLNRRQFLGGAVAVGGVLALPRLGLGDEAGSARARRTLVFLHLAGGNDGLNTVVPYADPRYRALRPSLAIDAGAVRKLDEALGLHPALSGLEALWRRERLAVVNGVGYPDPDYSHFRATEIWFTAEPDRTPRHGWIGRALEHEPSQAPLRAVALLKEQPLSLASGTTGIVTLTGFRQFEVPARMQGAGALYGRSAGAEGTRGEVGRAGAQALDVAARIARLKPAGGNFPGRLGEDLRMVLALLQADLGLECIQLAMGGYDTHSNQLAAHQRLLSELGTNLDAFQAALERAGLGERVVTVVMSEFGRRATENLSGGTDHGSAGPMFVVGQGVRPGLLGAHPSLEDLDRDNLRYTTDFRSVYAGVLRGALGVDPRPIVGDFEPLELFA